MHDLETCQRDKLNDFNLLFTGQLLVDESIVDESFFLNADVKSFIQLIWSEVKRPQYTTFKMP